MRLLAVLSLLQVAIAVTKTDHKNKNAVSSDRNGRILATYEYKIMENTGAAVGKLDSITSAVGNLSSDIGSLTVTLSQNEAEILSALDGIKSSFGNGSHLVTSLQNISSTVNNFFGSNSSANNSVVDHISGLYELLERKLTNIEMILGYDDYPPSPFGNFRDTDISNAASVNEVLPEEI